MIPVEKPEWDESCPETNPSRVAALGAKLQPPACTDPIREQKWHRRGTLHRFSLVNMQRVQPGQGQESVWDYPRPPRLESVSARLRGVFAGTTIADTRRGFRVLETSHPPTYYLPLDDILPGALRPTTGSSACEWKGIARYFDVVSDDRVAVRAAWTYPTPTAAFAALAGTVAFMAAKMERCLVDDEVARPQPGGFYGGWITDAVVGPFKGEPGTVHW